MAHDGEKQLTAAATA